MNRRQFFATSAALAAMAACEQRRVRLWLAEFKQVARLLVDAKKRGVVCWVSGSDSEDTRTNYCEIWGGVPYELSARRSIGCKVASRGVKTELLIRM